MDNMPVRPRRPLAAYARASLVLALAWSAGVFASTTLYKWTDENGVVHYSDQPHAGAEKIQVAKAQTYRAPPPVPHSTPAPAAGTTTTTRYQRVQITSPQDGDVLTNTGGQVPVSVDIEPALGPGHQLWLSLDGQHVDGASGADSTLSGVDRGTHTLSLQVVDAKGTVIAQGDPVSFSVRQASALHPNQAKPAGN